MTLYSQLSAGQRANGRILLRSGSTGSPVVGSSCASGEGGSGEIVPPRLTCASGGVDRVSGYQNQADAYIYNVNNAIIGVGNTTWSY